MIERPEAVREERRKHNGKTQLLTYIIPSARTEDNKRATLCSECHSSKTGERSNINVGMHFVLSEKQIRGVAMGHTNKKSLKLQIVEVLTGKMSAGRSKHDDKAAKVTEEHIYSYETLRGYIKQACYFADYCKAHHKAKTLQECRQYIDEFLQYDIDRGLSASTIKLRASALAKLYGCSSTEFIKTPARRRADITRSRGEKVRDKHFSEKNNAELINFCRGTGCRRNVLKKLEGRDLMTREDIDRAIIRLKAKTARSAAEDKLFEMLNDTMEQFPDQDFFIYHRRDKGGKSRLSPIIGEHKQEIIDRMRSTAPDRKVWEHVSGNADIHGYRSDYATAIYNLYARPLDTLSRDQKYYCRRDLKGVVYDKSAMLITSKALGHNRRSVIAGHYLR